MLVIPHIHEKYGDACHSDYPSLPAIPVADCISRSASGPDDLT